MRAPDAVRDTLTPRRNPMFLGVHATRQYDARVAHARAYAQHSPAEPPAHISAPLIRLYPGDANARRFPCWLESTTLLGLRELPLETTGRGIYGYYADSFQQTTYVPVVYRLAQRRGHLYGYKDAETASVIITGIAARDDARTVWGWAHDDTEHAAAEAREYDEAYRDAGQLGYTLGTEGAPIDPAAYNDAELQDAYEQKHAEGWDELRKRAQRAGLIPS